MGNVACCNGADNRQASQCFGRRKSSAVAFLTLFVGLLEFVIICPIGERKLLCHVQGSN